MGLNRLLKKLAQGETLEEALYKKLTEKKLTEGLYKTNDLGGKVWVLSISSSMVGGSHVIFWTITQRLHSSSWAEASIWWPWNKRILNGAHWKSYQRMSKTMQERSLPCTQLSLRASVMGSHEWDGRLILMAVIGWTMTDLAWRATLRWKIYGYINKEGKVVGKFRLPCEKDKNVDYRKLAEEKELSNKKE